MTGNVNEEIGASGEMLRHRGPGSMLFRNRNDFFLD